MSILIYGDRKEGQMSYNLARVTGYVMEDQQYICIYDFIYV